MKKPPIILSPVFVAIALEETVHSLDAVTITAGSFTEGPVNGRMTPPYLDLSFNWSYLPVPSVIVYVSCTNLTGRDHVYGYESSRRKNECGIYKRAGYCTAGQTVSVRGRFYYAFKGKINQSTS